MTLEKLILMLSESGVDADDATIIVKTKGITKKGEWYQDRILEWFDRPMRSWSITCEEKELKIMAIY